MDLISIIIPYYKKKKYINRSISSVINQTYTNFEIILVYDDDDKSELSYLINSYNSNKKISFINNKKILEPDYPEIWVFQRPKVNI